MSPHGGLAPLSQLAQAELGLETYVARYYDPLTGHFTQADTLIPEPGKASAFDRYAYVLNNPIKKTDPSGHFDIIFDLLFIGLDTLFLSYDLIDIGSNGINEENKAQFQLDLTVSAIDVACAIIPGATGGGRAAELVVEGGNIGRVLEKGGTVIVKVPEIVRNLQTVSKGIQTVSEFAQNGGDLFDEYGDYKLPNENKAPLENQQKGQGDGGIPGSNIAQNDQFRGAIKQIEKYLGKLGDEQIEELHREISGKKYGFKDIVKKGLELFEEGD